MPNLDPNVPIEVASETKNIIPKLIVCNSPKDLEKLNKKPSQQRSYSCEECNKKFATPQTLNVHKLRHVGKNEMPHLCSMCNYRGATKADLAKHSSKHGPRDLKCTYCDKAFHSSAHHREHVKELHEPTVVLKCGQCEFSTTRRRVLRCHLLRHRDGSAAVCCPLCEKPFQTKSNLKAHLLSHTGDKSFACDECGKKFSMRNRVRAHKNLVHSQKSHPCSQCHKSFGTVHLLRRHSLVHSGDKPFECCFCKFKSTTQTNLLKHIRSIHAKTHFTYKDVLEEIRGTTPPLAKETMDCLKKRGKQIVHNFLKDRQLKTNADSFPIQANTNEKDSPVADCSEVRTQSDQIDKSVTRGKIINGVAVGLPSPQRESTGDKSYFIQLPETYFSLQDKACFQEVALEPQHTINTPMPIDHRDHNPMAEEPFDTIHFDEDTSFSQIVLFVNEDSHF